MKLSNLVEQIDRAERAETGARLEDWNDTRTSYPRDATVNGLFVEQARRAPQRVAVGHGEATLTYGELDERSNRVARYLETLALSRETVVGVLLDRSLDVVPCLLGILKAGAAYLPFDIGAPPERTAYMLTEAGCPVLFSQTSQLPLLRSLRQSCPDVRIMCVDATVDLPDGGFASSAAVAACPADPLPERAGPRQLAQVIYTSGTSGRPKGVMIEHASIVRLARNTNYLTVNEDDRILQTGSLAFDASTFEIWGALLNGAALYLPEKAELLSAGEFERLLSRHGITTCFLTTSLFNVYAGLNAKMFQAVATLLMGGEKVSVTHVNKVREACPKLRFLHMYGPTENTTFTTFFPVDALCERDVPIGRPLANTTVHVLDAGLRPMFIGGQGELHTGGDGLARGYLNDPRLTAAKFVPDRNQPGERLYRTGDLARWLPDGTIQFIARVDQQIKVRGFRIEPAEIEQQIRLDPQVRDVVVVGKRQVVGDSLELCAYVVVAGPLDVDAFSQGLKKRLPDYMVPSRVVQLEQLPIKANGKVDRDALPDPWTQGAASGSGTESAASATEDAVLDIWREVLNRQDVGVTDDFFELGGHSLKATKLASLVQKRLGLEIRLTSVFTYPTVRQLARFVVETARFGIAIADDPVVRMNRAETGRALFLFPPGTGDALSFAQLANALDAFDVYAFNFLEGERRIDEYAELIVQVDARGPYRLAGYSGGGNLAYHVARALEERGKHVADLTMFDSARNLKPIHYKAEQARQLAIDFMADEVVRPYITSVVLQEKLRRRIESYFTFFSTLRDDHMVECPIQLIRSEDADDEVLDESGAVLISGRRWSEVTRGGFADHRGHGGHNQMLYEPYVAANARLLTEILLKAGI